jgi:bifunctional UDP-N-acetylglucosamine pyrophosphorylase / glucosamine-1-phosphate N-acetyltransferase
MKKKYAIILAAGKGTRMKSKMAKVLFPLLGKSLVERVVITSLQADCDEICVVVGHQKQHVRDSLGRYPGLRFADQDEQLGTGHAVMMAADALPNADGEVFILCGDAPLLRPETIRSLHDSFLEAGAQCAVLTMYPVDPGRYGRIVRNAVGDVQRIVEYKDATAAEREIREINTGIYCFDAKSLFSALKEINNDNAQHEYYLTDVLEILNARGGKVISTVLEDEAEAAGINSRRQLAELENVLCERIRNRWMDEGVSMQAPQTIWIDEDVSLAPDVEIGPGCILRGKTRIGEGCVLGPYCVLEDATLESGCRLEGFNALKDETAPAGTIRALRS